MKTLGHFTEMTREEFFKWFMDLKVTRKITHFQNHHTWLPDYKNKNSYLEQVVSMERYHIETNGWSAIAQHITTTPAGTIIVGGRSFNTDPAGISGHNSGGICCESIGNFDIGADNMTEEQKKTIIFVNAIVCFKFSLPVNTISNVYHHWFAAKTCPGTNYFGGNTKDTAEKFLYPLVRTQLNELKGVKEETHETTTNPSNLIDYTYGIATVKAKDGLWVHSTPDTKTETRVKLLPYGSKWKVLGWENGFYKVGGYISASAKYVDYVPLKYRVFQNDKFLKGYDDFNEAMTFMNYWSNGSVRDQDGKILFDNYPKARIDVSIKPILKVGSKGDSVKELQKVLGVAVDGSFGPLTEKALKEFQSENHLYVDGICGVNTWDKVING